MERDLCLLRLRRDFRRRFFGRLGGVCRDAQVPVRAQVAPGGPRVPLHHLGAAGAQDRGHPGLHGRAYERVRAEVELGQDQFCWILGLAPEINYELVLSSEHDSSELDLN